VKEDGQAAGKEEEQAIQLGIGGFRMRGLLICVLTDRL